MTRVALIGVVLAGAAHAFPVEVLRDAGPSSNRIDVVILGDGYRAADQAQLTADAQALVTRLFSTTPWREYAGAFNVKLIKVESNENGADRGTYGTTRDTALGATYYCSGIERLLCVSYALVYPILASHTPEYDVALVTVNDPKYGGSGGSISVASTAAQATEIIVHELGHSVGSLADEYETPYPGFPACVGDCPEANATLNATSSVKWAAWINPGQPIPTPAGTSGVGVFEGARYQSTGVYRPTSNACLMRSNQAEYCPVCRERLVKAFHQRFSTVDRIVPDGGMLQECVTQPFTVSLVPGLATSFQASWSLDFGALVDAGRVDAGFSLAVQPVAGSYALRVELRDLTPLVRFDPTSATFDSLTLTLSVTPTCTGSVLPCQTRQCLQDGGCGVAVAPDGTSCAPDTCRGETRTFGASCLGGTCPTPMQVSCAPYRCNVAQTACRVSCEQSADCATGFVCVTNMCTAPADGGVDGGADAGPPDAGGVDAGLVDGGVIDAGPTDAGGSDAGRADAGSADAGRADAGGADAGADAGGVDAGTADAGGDAGVADGGSADAGGVDAGAADAGHDDAGDSDAGEVDAGDSVDAGELADAGDVDSGTDGGVDDDGGRDAGDPRMPDAGATDAGVVFDETIVGGCGCTSADSWLGLTLLSLALLARKRARVTSR